MSSLGTETNVSKDPRPQSVASSLPPAPQDEAHSPPIPQLVPKVKPVWKLARNSVVRKKALLIVAMKAEGLTHAQIGEKLNISTGSVSQYLYRANQAGLLRDKKTGESLLIDPKDRIDIDIGQRVVRNLTEMLNSDDDEIRKEVTLEVAKGTLFKHYDKDKAAPMPSMNVLQVKIEMPETGGSVIRDGSIGGVPAYVEGEVVGEDD